MKAFIPNSAFLGNIDPFIRSLDLSDPYQLEVTGNRKWISIHPVILTIIASLGSKLQPENVKIDLEARSGHYLERMGLFSMLGVEPQNPIIEHEPSGRFIPLSRIKGSDDLSRFITDVIPLLHLEPKMALPIKYTLSELVHNVLEHSGVPDTFHEDEHRDEEQEGPPVDGTDQINPPPVKDNDRKH